MTSASKSEQAQSFGATRAPEIALPRLQWLNVERPLSLADLRGKMVILDFWTFCCINCMHVVPALRRVEEAFPEELVVIGVHSPKFHAEREAETVRHAIARYGVAHPVVHDPDFKIWQAYAVRAWPTLVFISPDGKVIGQHSGEPDPERLMDAVRTQIEAWRQNGRLRPGAISLPGDVHRSEESTSFRFPGKIKPVPVTPRLWALADAGHHQIALLDNEGRVVERFGSGVPGLTDGTGTTAQFNSPQGLICSAKGVFVADTNNHALRCIDLETGIVTTIAGTGRRGRALRAPRPASETALASPWDMALDGTALYIANAGSHQLLALDMAAGSLAPLAGSGRENIVDGPALEAQLAQPSGLALDPTGETLYFADSETSSVRALSLSGTRNVTTLVGTDLFDFGRQNGPFGQARLQHPLGLAWVEGDLLVADSYNRAIRQMDLEGGCVADFGADFECHDALCLPLAEPAGIWADGRDRVLLVDTNNHRVLEYRPAEKLYRTWAS